MTPTPHTTTNPRRAPVNTVPAPRRAIPEISPALGLLLFALAAVAAAVIGGGAMFLWGSPS